MCIGSSTSIRSRHSAVQLDWKGKGHRIGRRFDHVFASRDLNAVRCQYLHSLREAGLSDHSAIEVDFEPARAVDE